jgi:hypothetical protein
MAVFVPFFAWLGVVGHTRHGGDVLSMLAHALTVMAVPTSIYLARSRAARRRALHDAIGAARAHPEHFAASRAYLEALARGSFAASAEAARVLVEIDFAAGAFAKARRRCEEAAVRFTGAATAPAVDRLCLARAQILAAMGEADAAEAELAARAALAGHAQSATTFTVRLLGAYKKKDLARATKIARGCSVDLPLSPRIRALARELADARVGGEPDEVGSSYAAWRAALDGPPAP